MATLSTSPTGHGAGPALSEAAARQWRDYLISRMERAMDRMTATQLRRLGLTRRDIPARAAAIVDRHL